VSHKEASEFSMRSASVEHESPAMEQCNMFVWEVSQKETRELSMCRVVNRQLCITEFCQFLRSIISRIGHTM